MLDYRKGRWSALFRGEYPLASGPLPAKAGRSVLFFLVFLSGVSGLIYQVVWHRYLTILLGAQARATAVVLAIFLGGISAGYIVFGRWSRWKRWNLLLVYALVELGLGIWAFLFPQFFGIIFPLTSSLYGWFGVQNILVDIVLSCLLIGIPTFLMGGTLPLLTQGMAKSLDEASGTHAKIYGLNTVGACLGSLLAGYVLIPNLGLSVTCLSAGIGNCLISFFAYFLFAKFAGPNPGDVQVEAPVIGGKINVHTAILLAIGFCSGFYVLCLETVLIRIVGLSTGAAESNFTLIVSIFVFGLGFGSLVARKISRYTEAHLFWNQLAVSGLLLLLYYSANHWPYWVHSVRILFRDQIENFYVYQFSLGMMFLAVLVIPVSVCGLVLPLCFHLLKDRKETLGYRVGQLYGLNTVGAVLGAIVGGYVFLYFLNLDHLFRVCIGITLVMLVLSAYSYQTVRHPNRWVFGSGIASGLVILVGLCTAPPHYKENYLQPFRQQAPISASYKGWEAFMDYLSSASQILFHKDGPNSSVSVGAQSVNGKEVSRTIFMNGKSDGNTRGDFHTMSLTGQIPALLARKLDRVAVIGFGTGITAGSILTYDDLRSLDIIEISETLIKNAHYFDLYNGGVSAHPKVHFHQMDAFRYLGGTKEKYDLIVSEPSNPWVSGVENLYATEFYEIAKRKLNPDGLYVQWLQGYAFQDQLFRMVLKTISSQFRYVGVFQMMASDFVLVASEKPIEYEDLVRSEARYKANPRAQAALKRSGIHRFETVLAHEVMPMSLVKVAGEGVEPLELANPVLSYEANKAFFVRESVDIDRLRRYYKEYYPAADEFLLKKFLPQGKISADLAASFKATFCLDSIGQNRRLCVETYLMDQIQRPDSRSIASYPLNIPDSERSQIAELTRPTKLTGPFTFGNLQEVSQLFSIYKKYYSPLANFSFSPLVEKMDYCLAKVKREEDLYGDCLLQKAAIVEVVDPREDKFLPLLNQFNDWFEFLPETSPNYPRFRAAKQILDKLIAETILHKKKG